MDLIANLTEEPMLREYKATRMTEEDTQFAMQLLAFFAWTVVMGLGVGWALVITTIAIFSKTYASLASALLLLYAYGLKTGTVRKSTTMYMRQRRSDCCERLGLSFKNYINSLSQHDFTRLRGNYAYNKAGGFISKGGIRLNEILENWVPKGKTFVDLGAGRGGWSNQMYERGKLGTAVSFWSMHQAHEQWMGPGQIKTITADIRELKPFKVDIVLMDAGESNPDPRVEETRNLKLVQCAYEWIQAQEDPEFIVKVITPWSKPVREVLRRIQLETGKGTVVRLDSSSSTNSEMYFISRELGNIDELVSAHLSTAVGKARRAIHENVGLVSSEVPSWSRTTALADALKPFDITSSIRRFLKPSEQLRAPRNVTKFYKEIGFRKTEGSGSSSSIRNSITNALLRGIANNLTYFHNWQSTSTTPAATFRVFMDKVDKAPVEIHDFLGLMPVTYKMLAKKILRQTGRMKRLPPERFLPTLNRQGAMGYQERDLKWGSKSISNIGEYIDSGIWVKRLENEKAKLRTGKSDMLIFNSTGKKEKKLNSMRGRAKGSRLIWFLPATMRILEAEVFGELEDKLKYLPYTVTGVPLYDYGETIAKLMRGRSAICNDIAGFDTRISKSQQAISLEYFYKTLADQDLHEDMTNLFRIYTNPVIAIEREVLGEAELAFLQGRGQVASGRRITYGGNTVDNIVVNLIATAYSQGVPCENYAKWLSEVLDYGSGGGVSDARSKSFGSGPRFAGLFSGDDSILALGYQEAEMYAKKGHHVLNSIGWYRKDMQENEESRIVQEVSDIEFCSHNYTKVRMVGRHGEIQYRWMPVRDVEEIFAKSSLVLGKPKDRKTEQALARAHGLQLLVNYFHIPEVRAFALSLLSCTEVGLVLEGISKGYRHQVQPWLRPGGVVDIVNTCLFGESTTHRTEFRVETLQGLGYTEYEDRKRYFMPYATARRSQDVRRTWYRGLRDTIHDLREVGDYEDWFSEMHILTL